jgi:hypothetical protein
MKLGHFVNLSVNEQKILFNKLGRGQAELEWMTTNLKLIYTDEFALWKFQNNKSAWVCMYRIFSSIVPHFFIENDAEILPAHYTWKKAFTNLIHKQSIQVKL